MTMDLAMLAWSVALTWIMIMTASSIRTKLYTPKGMVLAFSNRDDLPKPTELFARADRAAKNMLENMVLFTGLVLVAHVSGKANAMTALGAQTFLVARMVYFPVYLIGIPYLRTVIWSVGLGGMALIGYALI